MKLWELRSRVRILTKSGMRFSSEKLYWDERRHELYSDVYSHLVTPERELQGSYFRSNESMTKYYVTNSKGAFEKQDIDGSANDTDSAKLAKDSLQKEMRSPHMPHSTRGLAN